MGDVIRSMALTSPAVGFPQQWAGLKLTMVFVTGRKQVTHHKLAMAFVYEATGRRDPYQCHAHLFLRRTSPASLCQFSSWLQLGPTKTMNKE